MRKLVTMLLCGLLAVLQVSAQTRTLKGRVSDDKGASVANASVTIKGTSIGTTSGADGNFTISAPSSAKTLVITVLGFATQEVAITGSASYSVSLKPSAENLDEVVVTGYAREKKSQFTGAANKIDTKGIETVPVGSFDQAFQGRSPGMLVNSGSGQPGASANITIRGVQSITGAGVQPLYIIDGVPLPAGDFKSLNPNDFESITVLKDAATAGMYGARGGLGVIVITTKRGKSGQANFQYRSQVGVTQRPDFSRLNLMSTAEMLQYQEREKFSGSVGWTYSPLNPAIPAGYTAAMKQKSLDSVKAIDNNWADILYRQGLSQSHELNMSGGNEKTRYYVSGSYFKQEGIDLGSSLTRYTTRFNLEHTENKLTVGLNLGIGYSNSLLSEGEFLGNSARNAFQMTYRAMPYENPYKPDGTLNYGTTSNLSVKAVADLLEGIQNTKRSTNQLKLNANFNLSYKLFSFLTFRNVVGVDFSNEVGQRAINANSYVGSVQTYNAGLDQEASRTVSNLINTTSLVFNKRFGLHDVEVGGYFEAVRNYQKALGFQLFNLDGRLTETGQGAGPLSANTTQFASSAKGGYGIRSFFGTARYTFDNKYTLTGNIRRDGTSRIVNPDNKEITTWSAGASWNAMQENFMKNQGILSDLKVRLSYGIVPNIGSVSTSGFGGLYVFGVTNFTGPQIPSFGTTSYAGSTVTGLVPTTAGNPNLKLETIQKANLGIDFAIWKNRARFSVDAYSNRTVNLFVNQYQTGEAGFGFNYTIPVNAGIMTNKGFEFVVNVDAVKTRDFGLTLGWNHSINKNNIEDLGGLSEYFVGTFLIKKGLPYGSHYGYNYLGADVATGQPRFETLDGKETFDVSKAGQFAKFGSYLPKNVGGFTLDVRFKAITVSALFSYQFDVVRSDNTRNWITTGTNGYQGGAVRGSRELLTEQWEKPGDVKLFQSSAYTRGFTSTDLRDAKFMRFRNLNIAYAIPTIKTASGRVLIKSARFYVQGQNLAIWSPWKGLDPEDDNNISLNEYPNPKAFVVGLDINF